MKQNKTKICHRNPCGHQTWLLTEKGWQPLVRPFIFHVVIEMIWFKSVILPFVFICLIWSTFLFLVSLYYFSIFMAPFNLLCLLALILCYFSDCFRASSMHLSFTTVCLQMIFYLFRDKNLKRVYFSFHFSQFFMLLLPVVCIFSAYVYCIIFYLDSQ